LNKGSKKEGIYMKNNKKRNIVAYVFAGLTVPLGFITILFLNALQQLLNSSGEQTASNFGEALGGALGAAFAAVFLIVIIFAAGLGTFVLGGISISILGTCIKQTEQKRKTANIVILICVSLLLVAVIVGIILVLFVLNRG
jgi:uncharacterized membrane protein